MKILGVDTTGESMSVAVAEDHILLSETFVHAGKKHSETLMTAVDDTLALCGLGIGEIDAFAVAAGPGSFTGIRIGVAAASAFAYARQKPVYAVGTLDALLANAGETGVVCAAMDARRGEVYAAARRGSESLVEACALPLSQLLEELMNYSHVTFVGDAGVRFQDKILEKKPDSLFLPRQFMLQRASSVCACAYAGRAEQTGADGLRPRYLRASQAERLKQETEQNIAR